jgi:thymidylate synthase ThyX
VKLFDPAPAAPAGISEWEQAFLKSLYVTEQRSKLLRSQIAREMARQVLAAR